jgi:hypothetical protein
MSNPRLATWDETRKLLREAREGLAGGDAGGHSVPTGPLAGTLDEFEEFLEHNELELAWDALASVAAQRAAPPTVWQKLARAADLMQLHSKRDEAQRRARPAVSSDQALATAREDAEKAYRDLSGYRVTVALEADGWHVDYDLTNTRANGGGPHYVIDPATGAILSKRYEQ